MGPAASTTRRARVSRGTLTRDDILRATVDLIEADPDQPITMERVARALGTRPMSLYTHVRNRDDLIEGAFDVSFRAWTFTPVAAEGWESQLRGWCRSLREHARRYSPLTQEWSRQGRFQPALLEKVADLARILRSAGLADSALADAIRWVPPTVLGTIVLELSRPADLQGIGDEAAAIYGSLQNLGPAAREEFLDLLPHYTEGSLTDLFEYSLDRLVEGVRCSAETARTPAPGGRS